MGRPSKFEERSEAIMQAFELCVARQGLAATTLNDVAVEAGLPRSLVRYFMGNRDEMVDRLVGRLMARAETSLSRVRDARGDAGLDGLLDLYFGEVFANELSNTVMSELWHLAREDEHVRDRVKDVYTYAIGQLSGAMKREGRGASDAERQSAAYTILSIALGDSSLVDFGIASQERSMLRAAADLIIDHMAPVREGTP